VEPTTIRASVGGTDVVLRTAPSLFSPRGLDPGTAALMASAELGPEDKVCDLGCGYGVVGIWAAKRIGAERVVMIDKDPVAVETARANAASNGVPGIAIVQSDGFEGTQEAGFTWILCNPPYHVDWAVPKKLLRKGFNRLALKGRFGLVVKRRDWYEDQMRQLFGGCQRLERDGYWVLIAEKRSATWADAKK
jgi:16S rRNA (guanine1207-N2)-methyltransferase